MVHPIFEYKTFTAMKYINEVIINKPIDEITQLFSDPNNMKEWQPGFTSMQLLSGEEGKPGAKSKLHYKMGKRDIEMIETIEVNSLPENFTATFETKGVYNHQKNTFEKLAEDRTRYVAYNEFRFSGIMKLFGWFMPNAFKKQSQQYMDLFKEFAEKQ